MRVAKLIGLEKFQISNEPVPEIKAATDVLLKVKAVGICGTDLHIFKDGRADVQLPRVMGHELSGLVVATGAGVDRVKVDDHAVLDPVFACGICETCKKGYPNVCNQVKCFGVHMEGGYQDFIVVDQKHLYKYNPDIPYETAALAEPFSIAANILERTFANSEDSILIIGSGTIGLSLLQAAKGIGARVMVADIVDTKLALASRLGADRTVNSKNENLKEAAQAFCPEGFTIVIDAVGSTPLFEQSLQFAAPRARIACIGFDGNPAQIAPVSITKKELSIIGSRMNCYRFPIVMEWLEQGVISSQVMISRRYGIEEIQKAFDDTLADTQGSIKTMICFD